MRRAWGCASEDEGSLPYWPFRQAMRGVEGAGPVVFDVALQDRRAETAAQERFRLFEAVADVLRAAAEPAGLLLVLDDMQWADPASLGLLVHLARGLAGSRLLIVAGYRDTETSGRQPLLNALTALTREATVTRLPLGGLSEPEVAEQLAQVTGWAVPGPVAAAVCARTRGNPFFVRELGRVLAESSDGALPDGVRDAVRGQARPADAGVRVADRVGCRARLIARLCGAGRGDRPRSRRGARRGRRGDHGRDYRAGPPVRP